MSRIWNDCVVDLFGLDPSGVKTRKDQGEEHISDRGIGPGFELP